jgi:type II secretory pathway predicted ATPase ExeA
LRATLAYVQHHQKVVGLKNATTLYSTLARIAEWAQGIPRRNNQVCTAALVAGAVAKAKVIDDTRVRQAINDLERK